jgi:hypothetical protein
MSKTVGAAFEAYGQAMAKSTALELIMRLALMEHEVRTSGSEQISETGAKFTQKLLRWDFGTLRQQVYQQLKLPREFLAVVDTAKEQRDFLAHNFWIGHLRNLRSERGLEIIIRHCRCIEAQIDRVSDYLIKETGTDVWRFITFIEGRPNEPEEHAEWERLLDSMEATFADPSEG